MSESTDVIIARSNSIVNSPRIRKIASSLKARRRTRVIGWNREGVPRDKMSKFVTDLDLFNFKGPTGRMIIILYLPIFWIYLFVKLVRYQPSVIHACDLDTLPPSMAFKIIFRKRLIFDVCDRYALSKIAPSNRVLYTFVNWLEEYLGKKADYMINVSKKMENTFKDKPAKTAVIMNCADDNLRAFLKTGNKFKNLIDERKYFTLVYTGNIIRRRGLEQTSKAIKNMDNIHLIMAGTVTDQGFLDELIAQPNIEYGGHLPFQDALALESIADAIVILYDKDIPNNRYANPNKLFEAMMFGIPVITNVAEEIVLETECGLLVEYGNSEQLAKALISLRDDQELRKKLGKNGRKAFESRYNWSIMEKTLFEIYEELQTTSGL